MQSPAASVCVAGAQWDDGRQHGMRGWFCFLFPLTCSHWRHLSVWQVPGMGMHKSASTGTGMNMAFGSGGGMGMSSSQSTSSSLGGGGIGPIPKADPFADLGQSLRFTYACFRAASHLTCLSQSGHSDQFSMLYL